MVNDMKGAASHIDIPMVMYIMLLVMPLIMGALTAIIFINLFRKNKRTAIFFGVAAFFSVVYQLYILLGLSLSLGATALVVYLFFTIAAYRKLKADPAAEI
ncbi:hypothetical protein [Planococcus sp. ISL-109]|uniref:hypothetical protein n=1 Tax=Planococcus sp. ISL-109 TaxID=2819166 RepID=UPI001BE4F091|nr:hypothetical protein [Planococcus sp. ISL-109]MBT2581243.1 hypothetical protein [Planococcus sp. ISL-109]